MRYGFADQDWAAAKAEMKAILAARAKLRGLIPYSDLVARVKAIQLAPDSFALAAMLGEISEEEVALGRGMLTVIVVQKHGDTLGKERMQIHRWAKRLGIDLATRHR